MNDPQAMEDAKRAIEQILKALGVTLVVCVDDIYTNGPTLEGILAVSDTLESEQLRDIFPGLEDEPSEDPQVRNHQIRTLWEDMVDKQRRECGERFLRGMKRSELQTC